MMTNQDSPEFHRLGVLGGDRACVKCGYNLIGQPILREPHYQMVIVRCAECGTVASLQEFPMMSRWAKLTTAMFAGFVLVGQLTFALGIVILLSGFSWGLFAMMQENVQKGLVAHQKSWLIAEHIDITSDPGQGTSPFIVEYMAHPKWIEAHPDTVLRDEIGIWPMLFNAQTSVWIFTFGGILSVVGGAWASTLPGIRRLWLPVVAMLPILIAAGVNASIFVSQANSPYSSYMIGGSGEYIGSVAERIMGGTPLLIFGIGLSVVLIAGLLLGRPTSRVLIRALVPPHRRCSFSWLWICDGLEPPTPRFFRSRRQPAR